VTAITTAAPAETGYLPASAGGVDRAIRISTAIAVLAVAGVAAYESYWHSYAVIWAHGESGITARLEPATIDGLVYASSMVIMYATRHRLPVPRLARWLLTLGIVATLAANMAQGWSHGPVGAVVAAWPAASLVGSYELLVWIIRTAAAGGPVRVPDADHAGPHADHPIAGARFAAQARGGGPGDCDEQLTSLTPGSRDRTPRLDRPAEADQASGPDQDTVDHWDLAAPAADQIPGCLSAAHNAGGATSIDAAAVAAYRASVRAGKPLSERKLAGMFGKTSRRWARSRIAEAQNSPLPA
jgi:Protein of unknown function (DUF2637)